MNDPFQKKPKPSIEVEPKGRDVRVNVGCEQVVHVCKMYGPLIFADIRVRAEQKTCEWIVERLKIHDGSGDIWEEVARVPGQMDEEFPKDEK